MSDRGLVVLIGGTAGIGREIAAHYAGQGRQVVLSGRDANRAAKVAADIGNEVHGLGLDLSRPETIADALAVLGPVDQLVLAAIERDHNTAAGYDLAAAQRLVTLKLVGYTEVVHTLLPRLSRDAAIVLFGGQAMQRPYPGSTTVSTINAGVVGMVHTLASELAPIRVNGIHPGIVGDSPYWMARPPEVLAAVRDRTPTGRLVAMRDVVHAVTFLLENPSANGINLALDGGWLLR
jgi:NAD(P)-dependent dehydrogenase (short-subunit alcohol dehydrogenase family)